MSAQAQQNSPANAWMVVDPRAQEGGFPRLQFILELEGERKFYGAIAEGDWLLVAGSSGDVTGAGRILRVRSDIEKTILYFDRMRTVGAGSNLAEAGLALPAKGSMTRLQWSDFIAALPKLTGGGLDDIPLIGDQAYLRELLQLAVMDDLLGPANGPREQIVDMGVRDRYLVGKLAPREVPEGGVVPEDGIEGLAGALATEAGEEPESLDVHHGRHEPGAEFDSTTGRVDAEADSSDEIDASSNQSLVPSSLGMTFCVDGDVKQIEVDARWGQYIRV